MDNGQWNVPNSVLLDTYGHTTWFCQLDDGTTEGQQWYEFRQYGTSVRDNDNDNDRTCCQDVHLRFQQCRKRAFISGTIHLVTKDLYDFYGASSVDLNGDGGDTAVYWSASPQGLGHNVRGALLIARTTSNSSVTPARG